MKYIHYTLNKNNVDPFADHVIAREGYVVSHEISDALKVAGIVIGVAGIGALLYYLFSKTSDSTDNAADKAKDVKEAKKELENTIKESTKKVGGTQQFNQKVLEECSKEEHIEDMKMMSEHFAASTIVISEFSFNNNAKLLNNNKQNILASLQKITKLKAEFKSLVSSLKLSDHNIETLLDLARTVKELNIGLSKFSSRDNLPASFMSINTSQTIKYLLEEENSDDVITIEDVTISETPKVTTADMKNPGDLKLFSFDPKKYDFDIKDGKDCYKYIMNQIEKSDHVIGAMDLFVKSCDNLDFKKLSNIAKTLSKKEKDDGQFTIDTSAIVKYNSYSGENGGTKFIRDVNRVFKKLGNILKVYCTITHSNSTNVDNMYKNIKQYTEEMKKMMDIK